MTADTPPGVALTWGVRPERRTGPRPSLTIERIAQAGIAAADRGGLAAVTMGAVAHDLGCTKMALYRYVDGKADLVAVMFDAAMGEPPRAGPRRGWHDALRGWTTALLSRYQAHPWAVDVPLGATTLTRNETLWLEAALDALDEVALSLEDKLSLVLLLNGHVLFSAKVARDATPAAGYDDPRLAAAIQRHDLPHVSEVLSGGHLGDRDRGLGDFEWGLECILAGVAAAAAPGRRRRR